MDKFEISYRFTQAAGISEPVPLTLVKPVQAPPNTIPASNRKLLLALWLVFTAMVCTASAVGHLMIGMNNDHLDLMDQVRRMATGGIPYVAFSDVNPPLIHILYFVPYTLFRLTGLPLDLALHGTVLALIGLSLFISAQILKSSDTPVATRRLLLSCMALALIFASFIHQAFADRDHLIMVLVSPWLVLYCPLARRDRVPAGWRAATAVMGAVGFAIKPYYYVLYATSVSFSLLGGVSLFTLMRQWEHYVVAGFALFYLCIIFTFFPHYPGTVLPVALHTYSGWGWDSKWGVIEYDLFGSYAVVGLVGTLALLLTARSYYDQCITYLFVLLLTAAALYALQAGWYYTQYPFIAVALVMAITVCIRIVAACGRINNSQKRIAALIAVYVFFAGGVGTYFASPMLSRAYWDIKTTQYRGHPIENLEMTGKAAAKVNQHLETHPRFVFFTDNMRAVNLLRSGTPRENVGRFDYLWPEAAVIDLENSLNQQALYARMANYLSNSITDDLKQNKPDMVINDVSPYQYGLPPRFNIIDWLAKDPRFAKAWGSYARVDSFDTCSQHRQDNCAYEIYYRK